MIVRNSFSPRGKARPAQRASRLPPSNMGSRDNLNQDLREHRLIVPEVHQEVAQHLANKPSARTLIETEVCGVAALFIFQPFHLAELSDA